jgi:hypothetical protein
MRLTKEESSREQRDGLAIDSAQLQSYIQNSLQGKCRSRALWLDGALTGTPVPQVFIGTNAMPTRPPEHPTAPVHEHTAEQPKPFIVAQCTMRRKRLLVNDIEVSVW